MNKPKTEQEALKMLDMATSFLKDKPVGIRDKQLVYCWDDNLRVVYLGFYDNKNKMMFCLNGDRDGYEYENYHPIEDHEHPIWSVEEVEAKRAELED